MSDHIPPSRTPALDLEAVGVCPDCKAGRHDEDDEGNCGCGCGCGQ
jgi:hypothetical protein